LVKPENMALKDVVSVMFQEKLDSIKYAL